MFPSATKPDRPVSYNLTRVLESAGLESTVHWLPLGVQDLADRTDEFPARCL